MIRVLQYFCSPSVVMADRGFQIKEDLLHYHCCLYVPPGARVKPQMTAIECKHTKEVASLRIHVERAIFRKKTFQLLKNTLKHNKHKQNCITSFIFLHKSYQYF